MKQVTSGNNGNGQKAPALITNIGFPAAKIVRGDLVSISEPLLDRSIVDASLNSISKVSTVQENVIWFFPRYPENS